jgi:hypothetical protein
MRQARCFPSLAVILGFFFLVEACSQIPPTPLVSTPTVVVHDTSTLSPTPLPPPLGAVPSNCTPGPTLRPIFAGLGPGIGQAPLWAFGFGGPRPVLLIPHSVDEYIAPYGWIWKIIWEVGPHFSAKITLRGENVRTGIPIGFQFLDGPIVASAVLDPQHPDHPVPVAGEGYAEWGSSIFIPVAGCYQIEAIWPGGQWSFPFAAGRQ